MKHLHVVVSREWLALSLSALAACSGNTSTAAGTGTAPTQTASTGGAATEATDAGADTGAAPTSASPTVRPRPRGLAALEAIGPLHGEPIRVGEHVQLAFVGGPERATAAWFVSDQDMPAGPARVADWPVGVRVLGGTMGGDNDPNVYVLVETLAVLGQAAGQKALIAVPPVDPTDENAQARVAQVQENSWMFGAQSIDELRALLAHPPAGPWPDDTAPQCRTLAAAARSVSTLGGILGPAGLSVYRQIQPGLYAGRRYSEDQLRALPAGTERNELLAAAAKIGQGGVSSGDVSACYLGGDSAAFVLDGGRPKLLSLPLPAAPGPRPLAATHGPLREVPHSDVSEQTRAAFRLAYGARGSVLAQAPLSASGGTIALGTASNGDDARTVLMVDEAGVTRFFESMDGIYGQAPRAESVRFADVNGDGRTDAFVWYAAEDDDGAVRTAVALIAPMPALDPADWYPRTDYSFAMAAFDSADVDAAWRAASALPTRGIDARAACRVLTRVRNGATFLAAATPDARVGNIGSFNLPMYSSHWSPASQGLGEIDGSGALPLDARACRSLRCSPDRPYCDTPDPFEPRAPGPPPNRWMFWFDTSGRAPRIRAMAHYEAS